jgi:hypothetical protein
VQKIVDDLFFVEFLLLIEVLVVEYLKNMRVNGD